jgi:hypothetical protein
MALREAGSWAQDVAARALPATEELSFVTNEMLCEAA